MRRYNVFYFIGQALSGLWRNGVMSFASIAVLMSCLVVVGGFSLLVANIDINLEKFGLLKEIVVFCDTDASEEKIEAIGDTIKKLDNVDNIKRVTKAEGLAEMQAEYDAYDDITEENNPLPDSYVITYSDNDKVYELEYQLKHIDGIVKVNNRLDLATSIEKFKSGIMLVFIWFLAILALVSVFIIVNTIKLSVFSRRNEISIMRYVGATGWFIMLPFIFEGMIIGILSSAIAYFIEWYVYSYIEGMVISELQMITILQFSDISNYVIWGFLAIGIFTGIVGSVISLARYLKK